MSFFKPRFPDKPLRPEDFEATFRMRGLKGFQPQHVVGFQDPFFADDPQYWILEGDLAGAGGFIGHIGVETPDVKDWVHIVDSIDASVASPDVMDVWVTTGEGAVRTALITDTLVTLRNRRDQGPVVGFPQRSGLLRILDNTNALTSQLRIARMRGPGTTAQRLELGYRLYKGEQLYVANGTVNVGLTVTMRGRSQKRT